MGRSAVVGGAFSAEIAAPLEVDSDVGGAAGAYNREA